MMIRVVAEHAPNLFAILGIFDKSVLAQTIRIDDRTYYRAESKQHYVLYRAAVSGWGAGGKFDARQQ